MPHRQHHNLFPVVMIESDIGSVSEFNHPLAELRRQLFDRTATLRMLRKRFHALPDCLDHTLGRLPAFGSKNEERMETCDIQQSGLQPPQSWHLGGTASLPASSLASQASAASAVAWRPVVW